MADRGRVARHRLDDLELLRHEIDLAIAHLRRMWKQELTAFANGKPLRDWKRRKSLWSALDNA